MRTDIRPLSMLVLALGCGGARQPSEPPPNPKLLHNEELNGIMKAEVNQPFSALMFHVFHAAETNPERTDLDFGKMMVPASTLREGIAKVRAMIDPPALTKEARAVFFTYVDAMVRDSEQLSDAVNRRERARTESLLTKISDTCTSCHHFFRLKEITESR